MDLRLILENIDWRLRSLELSDNEASDRAGAPDAIRNLRRKVAGELPGSVTMRTLDKLATALGCSAADLMRPLPEENVRPIPGLKGQLLAQLAYLNTERERVMRQLAALEKVNAAPQSGKKRKIR